MKVVALLPVKNEDWIIDTYLSSIERIADMIIVLDDGSTDGTIRKLELHPKVSLFKSSEVLHAEMRPNMSARRAFLLSKAREAGATHQIWLDADEAIPPSRSEELRKALSDMLPGERLILPWITLWKSSDHMRNDSDWRDLRKDFVFCDDGLSFFLNQELSESRTPNSAGSKTALEVPVLHFQFVFWKRTQLKQAWYRCHELLQNQRDARRINATYSITNTSQSCRMQTVPSEWTDGIRTPDAETINRQFIPTESPHYLAIIKWFEEFGPERFEGLEIWDIPELRDVFIERVGRAPRPRTFPALLISLNRLRHALTRRIKSAVGHMPFR